MKYSEVLYSFQPLETGDFMYRYYINDREYIIYSPEQGKISCLELCNFKDLTPFQLAVSIQVVKTQKEEVKEFSFEHVCSKEDLIAYLFDVTSGKTENRKVRRVSNNEGYFLYELSSSHKVRNFFQFNPNSKDYQLVFDNDICCAVVGEDTGSDTIDVCWSPVIFCVLEGQTEHRNTSYLLPSSNPILCAYICKKAQDRSAKINLHVSDNSIMNALLFFAYYVADKGIEKGLSVSYDNKNVIVQMNKWNPVTLVKFMSKIQKIINEKLRKQLGEEEEKDVTIYQLEAAGGISFLMFPNHFLAVDVFFRNIILQFGLEDIVYQEM